MIVYVYSMPKAGTYFTADLLERLGLHNTGYHLLGDSFLDTKSFSESINAERPIDTEVFEPLPVFLERRLADNALFFGHFPLWRIDATQVRQIVQICMLRDLRTTLISEFIDFRYRRTDIGDRQFNMTEDPRIAFCEYVYEHALEAHGSSLSDMLSLLLACQREAPEFSSRYLFMRFEALRQKPQAVINVARHLGIRVSGLDAAAIHAATLSAETKTKATSLAIDRAALWSRDADNLLNVSGLSALWSDVEKAFNRVNSPDPWRRFRLWQARRARIRLAAEARQ